jgi:hypothetical protein
MLRTKYFEIPEHLIRMPSAATCRGCRFSTPTLKFLSIEIRISLSEREKKEK